MVEVLKVMHGVEKLVRDSFSIQGITEIIEGNAINWHIFPPVLMECAVKSRLLWGRSRCVLLLSCFSYRLSTE